MTRFRSVQKNSHPVSTIKKNHLYKANNHPLFWSSKWRKACLKRSQKTSKNLYQAENDVKKPCKHTFGKAWINI